MKVTLLSKIMLSVSAVLLLVGTGLYSVRASVLVASLVAFAVGVGGLDLNRGNRP